jgi:ATP adenylyltransferase
VGLLTLDCRLSLTTKDLPFAYISSALPENPSPKILHNTYIMLHNNACRIMQGSTTGSLSPKDQSPISYNLGLTDRVMVLCPRVSEGTKIKDSNREDVGPVALNGTVLGGTLLVKREAEWVALRNDESKLKDVLSAIGFPPSKIEQDEKL